MTKDEYIEVLRGELERLSDVVSDYDRDLIQAALDIPIPTDEVELMPMTDAPNDKWFVLYTDNLNGNYTPVTVIWSNSDQKYVSFYGSWHFSPSDKYNIGWLPLPKVKGVKG